MDEGEGEREQPAKRRGEDDDASQQAHAGLDRAADQLVSVLVVGMLMGRRRTSGGVLVRFRRAGFERDRAVDGWLTRNLQEAKA
ncbi:hypothetical protein GCM10008179_07850 [Hansschlegelia plantiphila]|uniref:Uncharacterized protein n=1 Tax=Hansschlegelia plantiphila TaxID=374655 RepID=A0A9W6IYR8_9HYPH|nr:hypothetical protein GCM10008179_07850 [Hansschlegelia plantiphila]